MKRRGDLLFSLLFICTQGTGVVEVIALADLHLHLNRIKGGQQRQRLGRVFRRQGADKGVRLGDTAGHRGADVGIAQIELCQAQVGPCCLEFRSGQGDLRLLGEFGLRQLRLAGRHFFP